MLKKLIKTLTNNIGLKVMALICSAILWFVVVNIDDPTITKSFTTSVTIENESAIADMGKYYEVINGTNTVTFKVSAKRSVFKNLSNSDFKAVADMNNIENLSQVPIELSSTRYTSSVTFSSKTQYMEVSVEDLQTKQLVVTADYKGTPADNCAIGDVSVLAPNVLKISGPESIVSLVESAKATINVDGVSTSIADEVIPELYDADGNLVDTTKLTLNLDTVSISAEILDVKEVAVNFNTTGIPADGYSYLGMSYSPETVSVKGSAALLNTVNSIDIPAAIIDISGANANITQTIDISSYLPDGVTLVDSDQKKIDVTVTIEQVATQTYDVPSNNIIINNIPSGYEASFDDDTIQISVKGLASDLAGLSSDTFAAAVDASGLGEGTHTVTVAITLDESKYEINGTQTAKLTLTKQDTTGTSTTTDANTTTDKSAATDKKTDTSDTGTDTGNTADDADTDTTSTNNN